MIAKRGWRHATQRAEPAIEVGKIVKSRIKRDLDDGQVGLHQLTTRGHDADLLHAVDVGPSDLMPEESAEGRWRHAQGSGGLRLRWNVRRIPMQQSEDLVDGALAAFIGPVPDGGGPELRELAAIGHGPQQRDQIADPAPSSDAAFRNAVDDAQHQPFTGITRRAVGLQSTRRAAQQRGDGFQLGDRLEQVAEDPRQELDDTGFHPSISRIGMPRVCEIRPQQHQIPSREFRHRVANIAPSTTLGHQRQLKFRVTVPAELEMANRTTDPREVGSPRLALDGFVGRPAAFDFDPHTPSIMNGDRAVFQVKKVQPLEQAAQSSGFGLPYKG